MRFEAAVIKALGTLPKGFWQRVDGLMTEPIVMKTYPQCFPGIRLWFLERRGLIESRSTGHLFRSQRGLKSYRLTDQSKLSIRGR
jgi:hypothetical protein